MEFVVLRYMNGKRRYKRLSAGGLPTRFSEELLFQIRCIYKIKHTDGFFKLLLYNPDDNINGSEGNILSYIIDYIFTFLYRLVSPSLFAIITVPTLSLVTFTIVRNISNGRSTANIVPMINATSISLKPTA